MIRKATLDDQEDLLDLGERMHAESIYSALTFDRERARRELHWNLKHGVCFVHDVNERPVGLIMGYVKKPWFSSDGVGYEEALYVAPEHRAGRTAARLVEAWIQWCTLHGAKMLRPTTSCGSFAAERLYNAMGFEGVGATFAKVL